MNKIYIAVFEDNCEPHYFHSESAAVKWVLLKILQFECDKEIICTYIQKFLSNDFVLDDICYIDVQEFDD